MWNVASNYTVEKLKSRSIEHQDSYKLQWLNKDNEGGIKIKLARLPLNKFNEGKDKCKSLELLVKKEPLKESTKLCMSRPLPKPPWEVVSMVSYPNFWPKKPPTRVIRSE